MSIRNHGVALAVLAALTTLFVSAAAPATQAVFNETFESPPLTAGTAGAFYEDGWAHGDHGWTILGTDSPGSTNVGQRTESGLWPGNVYDDMGTVRNRGAATFFVRPLQSSPVESGTLTFALMNVLPAQGVRTDVLFLDSPTTTTGLRLQIGQTTSTNSFEVSQVGGAGTVVSDTSDGLVWGFGGSDTSGDYAIISIDFDVNAGASGQALVTVSSVDHLGAVTSLGPVTVDFGNAIPSVGQITFWSMASPADTNPGVGSLYWIADLQLTAVPEPTGLVLLGAGVGLALMRRRCGTFPLHSDRQEAVARR